MSDNPNHLYVDDIMIPLAVGDIVPDFKLATFEPSEGNFGEFSLDTARKDGKWTILFFYPADFTFV